MKLFKLCRPIDQDRDKETLSYRNTKPPGLALRPATILALCLFSTRTITQSKHTSSLINSLVRCVKLPSLTLKHYSISGQTKPDGTWVEAHDVFSAQVESVAILKKAPVIARSPFKGRTKCPQHRPQILTRGEQVNAATAFVSQPNIGLTSTAR